MADEINVNVILRKGRKFFYLRYECPITGERVEKSSGEPTEKEARRRAAEWQAELRAGGGGKVSVRWEEFRSGYEAATDISLRAGTSSKIASMCNVVETYMKPDTVRRINSQWLTKFQTRLLENGLSPATVES